MFNAFLDLRKDFVLGTIKLVYIAYIHFKLDIGIECPCR